MQPQLLKLGTYADIGTAENGSIEKEMCKTLKSDFFLILNTYALRPQKGNYFVNLHSCIRNKSVVENDFIYLMELLIVCYLIL